ncbi:MAG: hypothetical protein ACPGVT_07245 [Maricaulaceae bacterium]
MTSPPFDANLLPMTQMTPDQIEAALKAGIITQAQADEMGRDVIRDVNDAQIGNEDNMRFVRSFSDVFIAIGIGLFAIGLTTIAKIMGGGLSFIGAAAIMAFMAEYFGKKKRQHLPTLITALSFLIFTHWGLGGVISGGSGIIAALITLIAMLAFYMRIRLPFCIALIAISGVFLFFALADKFMPGLFRAHLSVFFVISGIVTMAVAIIYDMQDLHRTTRFADNAFWLHFTAAPLIVHGIAYQAAIANTELLFNVVPVPKVSSGDALLLLVIVGVVGVIGLALNRRALLVSSLGYAGFAIMFLFKDSGMGFGTSFALAFLLLGAAVIFLGAGWHSARNQLIKLLPKWRIFPPAYDPNFKG